jgi:hypothetical protein
MKRISLKKFTLAAFFAVLLIPLNSSIVAAAPECLKFAPCCVCPGYKGDITFIGKNTHFNETSQVSFSCPDLTVNSITAVSATELRVSISLPCGAVPGICTVEITTSDEIVTCQEGLDKIICENFCFLTVEPDSLRAGFLFPRVHIITIKSPYPNLTSESKVEIKGMKILKVIEIEPSQIRALVLIPPKLRITKGKKQVIITTDNWDLCVDVQECTGWIEVK